MNQQFDLKNITDAVLKAINNTDNELSAEEIANRVTEILKKNNVIDPSIKEAAKPTTSNTMENSSEILEEPKPLSGSFTLSEPPKPVETVDTREIDVPLNGSFGIKHKSFDDTVNHSDTASEISNNSSENITDNTDNLENNTEISEEPKPLSGSFSLSEPPKPVETVDTREIDVPLNGSFGITDDNVNNTTKIVDQPVINNLDIDVSNTVEQSINTISDTIKQDINNTEEVKPLDDSFTLSEKSNPIENIASKEINVPLSDNFGLDESNKSVNTNQSSSIVDLIKEAELSVSKKESEPLIINNSPESIEDLIKQAELSVNDNNTDIDNNSEEYIEPDYNSSDEPVEDEIEQFEDTTINDDFIIESIKNSEDFKNAVEKVIKDYLSSDEFTEKLKNILNALNN